MDGAVRLLIADAQPGALLLLWDGHARRRCLRE
jgi:hypothetical protein